jgi:hypothetical protein
MKRSQKHIIHKAMLWRKMLDEGRVKSLSGNDPGQGYADHESPEAAG